ncbi:MAG: DUF4276 family protein [bacterium]
MNKRLIIYCEGQTEEMLVERLLRQELQMHGVKVERPILAATSFDPDGQRGGFVNWDAIKFDLQQEFESSNDPNLRFTTFLDVFRMPPKILKEAGFTGPVSAVQDVETVERAMENEFSEPRFKAYLQRHELEALVLADIDALENVFPRHKPGIQQLRTDIAIFGNPEDINHGDATHPAARLETAVPGYTKNLKSSRAYFVLAQAGLGSIRAKCPRFDAWLRGWERWGEAIA